MKTAKTLLQQQRHALMEKLVPRTEPLLRRDELAMIAFRGEKARILRQEAAARAVVDTHKINSYHLS